MIDSFDDIRPYSDAEIPSAMQRIAATAEFPIIVHYLFPEIEEEKIRRQIRAITTADDFQQLFVARVIASIIDKTTDGVRVTGMEQLDPSQRYLFLSNHRDIVLDAALLSYFLAQNGHPTPEISFGANLMQGQLVIDLGKSNKMFRVERPGTVSSQRDFLLSSQRLSAYIRHRLVHQGHSIWLAQRNGRTKDGRDQTDPGLIKMLCLSGDGDRLEALDSLHIVPVSISYEWEPCDIQKAQELYWRKRATYVKKPGEDLSSILSGIMQPKGRVQLSICPPLDRSDFAALSSLTMNAFTRAVAAQVDERIRGHYHSYPNQFIAYDLLYGTRRYADRYSPEQKAAFSQRLQALLDRYAVEENRSEICENLLGIYAGPLR